MINYSVALKNNRGKDSATYPTKAYATAQIDEVYSLDKFAKHIADHGSVYGRGDIYAVLIQAVECLKELILQGKKISLGDLGAFYPTISSVGANTKADFTASNIKKLTVGWTKGSELKNMKDEATFQYVATRAVQAQSAAAERKTTTQDGFTVTITKDAVDSGLESEGDSNNTETGSDTGSGTGSGTGSDTGSAGGSGSDSAGGTGSDSAGGLEGE